MKRKKFNQETKGMVDTPEDNYNDIVEFDGRLDTIHPHILTNDPSITAWGWAVVTPRGKVIKVGCIKTKPMHKKLRIREGDDRVRRIKEINSVLLKVIKKQNVKFILGELPAGSQSSVAAKAIGIVTAILQSIGDSLEIPVEWFNEEDAKRSVAGKRSVAKDDMVLLINDAFDVPWIDVEWIDQGVADALAVFHVAQEQSTVLKMMR